MNRLSQRNPAWASRRLGTCPNNTFGSDGCLLMSLSMLAYQDPVGVNALFMEQGVYAQGCSIVAEKAAAALELRYDGRSTEKPDHICIAETLDFDKPSTPFREQHFFVFAPKGTVSKDQDMMLDPLADPATMDWEPARFRVASYRLFHEKGLLDMLTEEEQDAWAMMDALGVFTEHTKPNRIITTQDLAVFLSRLSSPPTPTP